MFWTGRLGTRRNVLWLGAVIVLCGVYGLYRHYAARTPTERIERLLGQAARAAEARSILRLEDVLARDYTDASGADRSMVLGQAQRFFDEVEDLSVKILRVIHQRPLASPEAKEAQAVVVLQVEGRHLAGGDHFSGIGAAGGDAFLVGFRQRDGKWKVSSSRYLKGRTSEDLTHEIESE